MDHTGITLTTIAKGAVTELFQAEVTRVVENMLDPNTDPLAARAITIKITFKGSEKRDGAKVSVACGSKLAGIKHVETEVLMGLHQGKPLAVEHNPQQNGLFDSPPQTTPAPALVFPGRTGSVS